MKSPLKLQEKLRNALRNSKLHIQYPFDRPWSDLELREIAWVVEDHVNRDQEVVNCSPLKDWLEEYKFYLADFK